MSNRVQLDKPAPDFALTDPNGKQIRLSDFRGKANVLLVFNRGFVWPFCQRHMAQLRRDFSKFQALGTEIIVVGPEGADAFNLYWKSNKLPFIGLPDPTHSVLKRYGQEVNLFKLGRMPAQVIIDKQGVARYVHYGHAMSDIPENEEVLEILQSLIDEEIAQ